MKTNLLSIDSEIFKNMLAMSSEDMHELVNTIGISASMTDDLLKSWKDKIIVAIAMLQHSRNMLEQCHCSVDIKIDHSIWTEPILYVTDANHKEE